MPYQILLIPEFFLEEGDLGGFFYMKREKRYFYKICRFFFISKVNFDRICIPPPKKDWGI